MTRPNQGWRRLFAPKRAPTSPRRRAPGPCLEPLEDRTLLSAGLFFEPSAGLLATRADTGGTAIHAAFTAGGYLDVTVDGRARGSDPTSAEFDPALAGATATSLKGIRLDGDGDTLVLGAQKLPGDFAVSAGGAAVVLGDLAAAGALTVRARDVTVAGAARGGAIELAASGRVTVEAGGLVAAARGAAGGRIDVSAGALVNAGQVRADGLEGGSVLVRAGSVLNAGALSADGADGGGAVRVAFAGSYEGTAAAGASADGGAGRGGAVALDGGATGRLFSSGRERATGSAGGAVDLLGREVVLVGGAADASGAFGGGSIRVGGDLHGANPAVANAAAVSVAGTALRADALARGGGGRVVVWADGGTDFAGSAAARGGPAGGPGGLVEVSGKGALRYAGSAGGAAAGRAGRLLLDPKDLVVSDAPAGELPQFNLTDPHPTPGAAFGQAVAVLAGGNVVVTNPADDFGGAGAGAAYLFDGLTGALVGALVGGSAGDAVGSGGVVAGLAGGNYLVRSAGWGGGRGAATWGGAASGASGVVSAANSLVGSAAGDHVGSAVTALPNGGYVVVGPTWGGGRGAATWGSGAAGVAGAVSAANSLTGSGPGDLVGSAGVTPLANGNYVVRSPNWNGSRGAATWGSGTAGVAGVVSAANSLIGSSPGDLVGGYGITVLASDDYVIASPFWNGRRGAATWGSGRGGVVGPVSAANSLTGPSPNDLVGGDGVTALHDGNYVVLSVSWNESRGAATWGSGTAGVVGPLSPGNSLTGSNPDDRVGFSVGAAGVVPLANGNYVVASPNWNGTRGAATWGSGATGVAGPVSAANSLTGSSPGDLVGTSLGGEGLALSGVTALANGNYVVGSHNWNGNRGAVTWASGTAAATGVVSAANSLTGSSPNDSVGGDGVTALDGGNYVVVSSSWNGSRGAATWGSGAAGVAGAVSAANSLTGSSPNDYVGGDGVATLAGGNYVVLSESWGGNRGAATWGSGAAGVAGAVSAANSLTGSSPNDYVGYRVTALAGGGYVVASPNWSGSRGAATWGGGAAGLAGAVSAANSLTGSSPGDSVGGDGVAALYDGDYVVLSASWGGGRGAATWGSGTAGLAGAVSAANSLNGSSPGDLVGSAGVTALANGHYVIRSPSWGGNRGAVTWGDGAAGVAGAVSAANSLTGSSPNDLVGSGGVTALADGDYLVRSPSWNGGRGAATWADGRSGRAAGGGGAVTGQNSLVGRAPNSGLGVPAYDPVNGALVVAFAREAGGRVASGLVGPNPLSYARGQAQAVTVTPDLLTRALSAGADVVLQASNDITIDSPVAVSGGGGGGALTLQAGRSILLNASITTDNGALTLVANDRLSGGVVDAQRDPGNAVIAAAPGAALDTGSAALTVGLLDGAGKTNAASGAVTLGAVNAGVVSVANNGPSLGSDVVVGPVTSGGSQSYSNPNGITVIAGDLAASDVTFLNSVALNAGQAVRAAAVHFAGGGTQDLQAGDGASLANLVHDGGGTLRLTSALTVAGDLTNSQGALDASDQAVTVGGLTTIDNGTRYLGGAGLQYFAGGLSLPRGGGLDGSGLVLGGDLSAGDDPFSGDPATITGSLSLGGASSYFSISRNLMGAVQLLVGAVLSDGAGGGQLTKDGAGTLCLTGDSPFYSLLTVVLAGNLVVDGALPGSFVSLAGGTLSGVGSVAGVSADGGTLGPGGPSATGVLISTGDVALASPATFSARLNGPAAGGGYDQLAVQGAVDLNGDGGVGSTLAVALGYAAAVGDAFTVLQTTGGVLNTFQGLAEGATFLSGDRTFQITYAGNGGTDVVLTCVG